MRRPRPARCPALRRLPVLLAVVVLAALGSPAASGAASPLLGQWPLDGATTGVADSTPDVSGNGLALTSPANTMRFAPGRFGNALAPAGQRSLEVTSALLAPQRLTLLAWVKQSGDPGRLRYIAGRGDDGANCGGSSYALYTSPRQIPGLRFYVRQPGATAPGVYTDAPPDSQVWDGQWHLVAGTFDGQSIRLFVDGQQVGAAKPATGIGYASPITGQSFYVDGYPPETTCPDNSDFPGQIDDVRVYDRALSTTELGRLAAAPGGTPPVLVPDDSGSPTPAPTPTPPAPAPAAPAPTTSTPTPTTPAAPSVPPASAAFSSRPGLKLPGRTILDATATRNAGSLDWSLGAGTRPDVRCPGSQPYLGVTVGSAASGVGLTANGTGASSVARSATTIAGLGIPSRLRPYAPPDIAVCAASMSPLVSRLPTSRCVDQTVVWGLISAQGCFGHLTDVADVPAPEREVIRSHYDAEKTPLVVVSLCAQAAKGYKPQSLCDDARKLLADLPFDVYASNRTVDLDGIKVTPKPGAQVVIFPQLRRVVSSNATMTWGGMTVRIGAIDLNLKNASNIRFSGEGRQSCACGRSEAIARYDGKRDLPAIGGFKLDGSVDLALEGIDGQRYSSGVLQLRLPPQFAIFGGNPPSGTVRVLGQNGRAPTFDDLDLQVPEAAIGPIRLSDVRFRYAARGGIDRDVNSNCTRNEWKAQANIFLSGGRSGEAGFRLTPPPAQNGIGFCNGSFQNAGGALVFGGPIPRPQLFPGVFLDEVNFAIRLNPLVVRGGGAVSVADIARVRGALLLAFGTPSQPYVLTPSDAGREFKELAGRRFDSTTIAGGGSVDLKFPGVGYLPVGDAAVMYSFPDHIVAGGSVRVPGPGIAVYGHAGIEAKLNQGLFSANIGGKACLAGIKKGACIGGDGWVTSKGMVACLDILDTFHPGAGIEWASKKITIWPLDGCKPSRYWVKFQTRAKGEVVGEDAFTVAPGEAVKNVRLAGTGGAPKIRVTAPGGETLDLSGDDFASSTTMVGVRDEDAGAAYVGVKDGRPGTYRVSRIDDSVPFGALSETRPGYDTDYSARVEGSGATRRLVYDARKEGGGQRVTFAESGKNLLRPITTVTGGKGVVRFRPEPGQGEMREIVAISNVEGVPQANQTLARYRVGTAARIAAPRGVRAVRHGTTVTVTWKRVAGARSYGVLLRLGVGRQRQLTAPSGRRSIRIRRVGRAESGVVRVSARDDLGHWGRPRTSRPFRAIARVPTVLQTATHNERRDARSRRSR